MQIYYAKEFSLPDQGVMMIGSFQACLIFIGKLFLCDSFHVFKKLLVSMLLSVKELFFALEILS